jgi:REP element-mobilizing transposase RayT
MARPLRIERPGVWYHVTARGNERRPIYRDDRDRRHFCELLGEAVGNFGLVLHAYVLMENHFHLLLETPEANLSRAMQWLNVSYSVWFNRRHDRVGHLRVRSFPPAPASSTACGLVRSRACSGDTCRL